MHRGAFVSRAFEADETFPSIIHLAVASLECLADGKCPRGLKFSKRTANSNNVRSPRNFAPRVISRIAR